MIFLNGIAMIALTALAVPVMIHLHRRRKSKVVDWAAMRFLSHSLAKRRRGMELENFILLLCRCLLVVLFVLAMTRPQLTSASDPQWILATLLGSAGLIALVWATVTKSKVWIRSAFVGFGVLSVGAAVVLSLADNPPLPRWGQPRDVAIVLDASSSMNLEVDGKSNFRRACDEANLLVDHLPGGSTVSVLLAGPVISSSSSGRTNLRNVSDELLELDAVGGGTNLRRAIEQSRLVLKRTPNARKQVVVFSDNQLRSWQQVAREADSEPGSDVSMAGTGEDGHLRSGDQANEAGDDREHSLEVFCRVLPFPTDLNDVSVTGIELERGTPCVHRPVSLVAKLFNGGGSVNAAPLELELLVNDQVVQVESVPGLAKHSRTSVRFKHTFDQPGWNTVSARLRGEDGLQENNRFDRVVHIAAELPVLIINGDSTNQSSQRASTFLQLALDPHRAKAPKAESKRSQLTKVDVIEAAEVQRLASLSDYNVVLLCDVPRLPSNVADALAAFVEKGGGLWVLPGPRCEPSFYNNWSIASTGRPLLPVNLLERMVVDHDREKTLQLDFDSVAHVTLDPLFEAGQHDLSELQVSAHWKLDGRTDRSASVAARLSNGDPLLVERSVGRGRVLMTSISLDSLESNLIKRVAFPVLAHLWVEYLAAFDNIDLNHRPQRNLLIRLDRTDLPSDKPLTLKTPDGNQRPVAATLLTDEEQLSVAVGTTIAPGLYRIAEEQPGETTIPFTIACDQNEFDLTAASNRTLDELGRSLQIQWITDVARLEELGRGTIEGIELWKYFAVGALAMVVVEVVAMRWVAWRRRELHSTRPNEVNLPWQTSLLPNGFRAASTLEEASPDALDASPPLVEVVK